MRKILAIFITALLLTGAGCSDKDVIRHYYYFSGENENWTGEYIVSSIATFTEKNGRMDYEGDSDSNFKITYKGDVSDLASIKTLKIGYDAGSCAGEMSSEYTDGGPKEKTFTMRGGSSGTYMNEDEVIKVTINMDGEIQTMELKVDKRYSSN